MISELKIELNNRIISNESNFNHSHIINHLFRVYIVVVVVVVGGRRVQSWHESE